eukprot:2463491-Prymnesium_polylepis.1
MGVGTRVTHESRGQGVVTRHLSDPVRICIQFDEDGVERPYAKHSWDKLHLGLTRSRSGGVAVVDQASLRTSEDHRESIPAEARAQLSRGRKMAKK